MAMMMRFVLLCLLAAPSVADRPLVDVVDSALVQTGIRGQHSPRAHSARSKAGGKHSPAKTDPNLDGEDFDDVFEDPKENAFMNNKVTAHDPLPQFNDGDFVDETDDDDADADLFDEIDDQEIYVDERTQRHFADVERRLDDAQKEANIYGTEMNRHMQAQADRQELEEDHQMSYTDFATSHFSAAPCALWTAELTAAVYGFADCVNATNKACRGSGFTWDCDTNIVGCVGGGFGLLATVLDFPTECVDQDCRAKGDTNPAEISSYAAAGSGILEQSFNLVSASMDMRQACWGIDGERSNDDLALAIENEGSAVKQLHWLMATIPMGVKVKEMVDLAFIKLKHGYPILESHPGTTCEKSFGLVQSAPEFAERFFQSSAHMLDEDTKAKEKSDFACKAAVSKLAASIPALISQSCKVVACSRDEREPRLIRKEHIDANDII